MNMEDKSLFIPGYGKLPHMKEHPSNFVGRASILTGPSETGKTVFARYIMKIMQAFIANVIIICPTNEGNQDYNGLVPARCILANPTIEVLREILERQKNATKMFNVVNNILVLEKLFRRCNSSNANHKVDTVNKYAKYSVSRITTAHGLSYGDRDAQIKKVEKTRDIKLKSIYRQTIAINRRKLQHTSGLDNDEKYTLKFLYFNNSMLIVLDDCAPQIKKWGKDESVRKLFFESRHWGVTSFFLMHNATLMRTEARQNAFNNVFTDVNCAIAFFNNKANSFPAKKRKELAAVAEYLFKDVPNGINFKKLIYNRKDTKHPFRYAIAKVHPPFKMGGKALWKFCDGIPTDPNKGAIEKSSKYHTSFGI